MKTLFCSFSVCVYFNCLYDRTTLRFDFLHSFMVVAQTSTFQVHGYKLVTNSTKMSFFFVSDSFLLAIWFCIYTHAQLRILKFQDSVYQKCCSVLQTIKFIIQKLSKLQRWWIEIYVLIRYFIDYFTLHHSGLNQSFGNIKSWSF